VHDDNITTAGIMFVRKHWDWDQGGIQPSTPLSFTESCTLAIRRQLT